MPESLVHVQKCVMMIDDVQTRVTLMEKIFKYSQEHKAVYFRRSTDEPPNGYRRYQCHIKGVEHYKFTTDSVRRLMNTVAYLTGIDQSEIHVDGIQMTNSIYITFLVKDVHYTMFHALLKKGLPLLSELSVDMVTFLDTENGETIDVSSGRNIYHNLPPVQESPEQTIQRLSDAIEKVQILNIDQKREIEQLSATVELLSVEVQMDSKTLLENVRKAMQDAYEEGVSKRSVLRVISSNTKLVKSIEKKGGFAIENKLRAEIQCLEAELEEAKGKLELFHESESSEDEPAGQRTERKQESTDEDNNEDSTEAARDMKEQGLLISLQDALNRAQDLGYAKTVIDQIVLRNTLYAEYKCLRRSNIDRQYLQWNYRLLQDDFYATNSLLQKTAPAFAFKQGLMSQLENIFKSKGSDIPADKGYKVDIMMLAMELSSQISDDEEQKLVGGFKDVEITSKVNRDRRFLILRLFYVENLNADNLILLEVFVGQKLHVIDRKDLGQIWSQRVRPRDPVLQFQETHFEKKFTVHIGLSNPELVDLFKLMGSKLTNHDRRILRKMLPKGEQCPDEELLFRLVQMKGNAGLDLPPPDVVLPSVGAILNGINRIDLQEEFEIRYLRFLKVTCFGPDLREILRSTCSKISKAQKKKMKSGLMEKRFVDNDDDILGLLVQEKFECQERIRMDEIYAFVRDKLQEFKHQPLQEEFEKKLIQKSLKVMYENVQVELQPAGSDKQDLILEKLAELSEEIKSMKSKQAVPQTTVDVHNPALNPFEKLTNETKYRQFFKDTIRPAGVFDFRN